MNRAYGDFGPYLRDLGRPPPPLGGVLLRRLGGDLARPLPNPPLTPRSGDPLRPGDPLLGDPKGRPVTPLAPPRSRDLERPPTRPRGGDSFRCLGGGDLLTGARTIRTLISCPSI